MIIEKKKKQDRKLFKYNWEQIPKEKDPNHTPRVLFSWLEETVSNVRGWVSLNLL